MLVVLFRWNENQNIALKFWMNWLNWIIFTEFYRIMLSVSHSASKKFASEKAVTYVHTIKRQGKMMEELCMQKVRIVTRSWLKTMEVLVMTSVNNIGKWYRYFSMYATPSLISWPKSGSARVGWQMSIFWSIDIRTKILTIIVHGFLNNIYILCFISK